MQWSTWLKEMLLPYGNAIDDGKFWLINALVFWLVYYLRPYIKWICGILVVGFVMRVVFIGSPVTNNRRHENAPLFDPSTTNQRHENAPHTPPPFKPGTNNQRHAPPLDSVVAQTPKTVMEVVDQATEVLLSLRNDYEVSRTRTQITEAVQWLWPTEDEEEEEEFTPQNRATTAESGHLPKPFSMFGWTPSTTANTNTEEAAETRRSWWR